MRRHKHKFNATQVKTDVGTFHSKLEHKYFLHLELLRKAKAVLFFLRQVPFHLPGNRRYVLDFQIFWTDGDITFVDVKGFETPQFIDKKKEVEALYPIEIKVIKQGDF